MNDKHQALGLLRISVVSPELKVADVAFNSQAISAAMGEAAARGCRLAVFPELCVTGYSCGDLFYQSLLLEEARRTIFRLAEEAGRQRIAALVGAPVVIDGRLFNCALFLAAGRIVGIVPKTFLPNTQEYYEERWFSCADDLTADRVEWEGQTVPVGTDLLFRAENYPDCVIGVEVCEDVWVASPPSGFQAVAGAVLLCNLSASPETLGKADYRRALVQAQSARCLAAYAYASAGPGESSTDLVFSGHSLIAENGVVLTESERFRFSTQMAMADIDLERLRNERLKSNSFAAGRAERPQRVLSFSLPTSVAEGLLRPVPATPFVPPGDQERSRRCREIFALQTTGLAKRLRHTEAKRAVIGLSGGLDSTLALLVTVKA
ncbi:MAG TPA: nitrilase-related carbon-nitrogen hydrolase, partial [Desulfuromonadales bacterium]|nr:nitrilase-related carbon-nitrogen hydrolase [Desulfuromonadales bacterium]